MATVARQVRFFNVRRGVLVAFVLLVLCLALALGVWVSGKDLPVEYRTAQVWIPEGAIMGDVNGVPAVLISFQDYRAYSQEFTSHVITVMRDTDTGMIKYLGSRDGILFRADTSEYSIQSPPQGFWYSFIAKSSGSLDLAAGGIVYVYSPWPWVLSVMVVLGLVGIIGSIFILYITFDRLNDGDWLASPFFR